VTRRQSTAATVALIALLALSACAPSPSESPTPTTAGPTPSPTPEPTPVPTLTLPAATLVFRTADPREPPPPSMNIGCAGVGFDPVILHGGHDQGGAVLVWVEDEKGRPFALLWPNGFTVQFDPEFRLLDANGAVIGGEGDVLDLGGTPDPAFSNLFEVWEINGVGYPCTS